MEIISMHGFLQPREATDMATAFQLAHEGSLERHEGVYRYQLQKQKIWGPSLQVALLSSPAGSCCVFLGWNRPPRKDDSAIISTLCQETLPRPLQILDDCDNEKSRKEFVFTVETSCLCTKQQNPTLLPIPHHPNLGIARRWPTCLCRRIRKAAVGCVI